MASWTFKDKKKVKNNKAETLFRLNFNVYTEVDKGESKR